MSIQRYLEQLRSKPERVRRKILLSTTGTISVVIFLFWWGAVSHTDTRNTVPISEVLTPWGTIKKNISDATSEAKTKFKGAFGEASSTGASAPTTDGEPKSGLDDIVYPDQLPQRDLSQQMNYMPEEEEQKPEAGTSDPGVDVETEAEASGGVKGTKPATYTAPSTSESGGSQAMQ